MTVALDCALPAADAGMMADGKADQDPEVPERARRRTFTAKYKLEVLAAYDGLGIRLSTCSRRRGEAATVDAEWSV
jgi:hypothetical protein